MDCLPRAEVLSEDVTASGTASRRGLLGEKLPLSRTGTATAGGTAEPAEALPAAVVSAPDPARSAAERILNALSIRLTTDRARSRTRRSSATTSGRMPTPSTSLSPGSSATTDGRRRDGGRVDRHDHRRRRVPPVRARSPVRSSSRPRTTPWSCCCSTASTSRTPTARRSRCRPPTTSPIALADGQREHAVGCLCLRRRTPT